MNAFWWSVVILLAAGAGILLVLYLTVHPLEMSLYLALTLVTVIAVAALVAWKFEGRTVWFAALAAVAGFGAGYWYMTGRFLAREDRREIPVLTRQPGDPGKGHLAVVYFTHGEPATYDPIGWINQFREFDEQGIAFVPYPVRPLFAFMLRQKYLTVGKSDHHRMHRQMMQSLERAFRADGDTSTRFYLSFLDDAPRPDAALIHALNDGASRVIVSEVFLTISNHTAEGEELVRGVNAVQRLGVPVEFTGPLWDSGPLAQMFVHRVRANLAGTPKAQTGILLVGHGQPKEWDERWPTETAQELEFRRRVLALLEQDGFPRENLGLAWMEFRKPKIAPAVEELAGKGIRRLLYFSAAISADAIHSQFDTPELVEEVHLPEGVTTVNLGAWNDDPLVIKAIQQKIQAVILKR